MDEKRNEIVKRIEKLTDEQFEKMLILWNQSEEKAV